MSAKKLLILMVFLMSVVFYVEKKDGEAKSFQADSETLVTGVILAKQEQNLTLEKYGLGRYENAFGVLKNYGYKELNDKNWHKHYSVKKDSFALPFSAFNEKNFTPKKSIICKTGHEAKIQKVQKNAKYLHVYVEGEINFEKCGEISQMRVKNESGDVAPTARIWQYKSQVGAQGLFFSKVAEILPHKSVKSNGLGKSIFYFLMAFMSATILSLICFFVYVKFGRILLAATFYGVFLTSPWIVNFSANLYWVMWTWFLPVLLGFVLSVHKHKAKIRWFCFVGVFVSMFVKCLCGYEYISTILVSSVAFLLIDIINSVTSKNYDEVKFALKLICIFSFFAILGFVCAFLIHANIRGSGDLLEGIKHIYRYDILRRTYADSSLFAYNDHLKNSLNASTFSVLKKYFYFKTNLAFGVGKKWFIVLALAPVVALVYSFCKSKTVNKEILAFYVLSFLATASWFVLAKGHSYIHGHMNYVLWYFGFMQICFYAFFWLLIEQARKLYIYFVKNKERIKDETSNF